MTATIADTQLQRRQIDDTGGSHCVLCDRLFPGQPAPIPHCFVLATRPNIVCGCSADHRAAAWHSFVVVTQRGIVAGGMLCPRCAVARGLDAALDAVARRAYASAMNTN